MLFHKFLCQIYGLNFKIFVIQICPVITNLFIIEKCPNHLCRSVLTNPIKVILKISLMALQFKFLTFLQYKCGEGVHKKYVTSEEEKMPTIFFHTKVDLFWRKKFCLSSGSTLKEMTVKFCAKKRCWHFFLQKLYIFVDPNFWIRLFETEEKTGGVMVLVSWYWCWWYYWYIYNILLD